MKLILELELRVRFARGPAAARKDFFCTLCYVSLRGRGIVRRADVQAVSNPPFAKCAKAWATHCVVR